MKHNEITDLNISPSKITSSHVAIFNSIKLVNMNADDLVNLVRDEKENVIEDFSAISDDIKRAISSLAFATKIIMSTAKNDDEVKRYRRVEVALLGPYDKLPDLESISPYRMQISTGINTAGHMCEAASLDIWNYSWADDLLDVAKKSALRIRALINNLTQIADVLDHCAAAGAGEDQ